MDAIAGLLNKLSVDDVEKLKILFSINAGNTTNVITLRVFVNEYEDLIKKTRTENYYKSVKLALKHLTDYFGLQRPLASISFRDVELFITELQKNAPKGSRVYYRTLKAAFNKALDWNYISENHFIKIKLAKKKQLNPDFITEDELKQILERIDNDVVYDAVVMGFYTGLRLNELMNLKWNNIDKEKGLIVVGDAEFTTKGKNQRYVPISDEVRKVFQRCKKLEVRSETASRCASLTRSDIEGETGKVKSGRISQISRKGNYSTGYVFCKENGFPYSGDYVSKMFKKACIDAGIRDSIHFHSLRHSFASNLVQRGVPLYVIKELLGHSSIAVTEIYSHLNMDSLREAVAVLDKRQTDNGFLDKGLKTAVSSNDLRLIVNGDYNEL